MPPEEDDTLGALERSRERLYDNAPPPRAAGTPGSARPSRFPHAWATVANFGAHFGTPRHVAFASRFFTGAVVFFVIAIAAALLLFFTGSNIVSVDNIALSVSGPTSIASGDTVPLSISITNKNPVALANATIEVSFPEGTRSATDVSQNYPSYNEDLGTLSPGQTVTRTVKAVLFGGEGTQVTLPITFSYGAAGSNATFEKRSSYPLTISTAPLSVSVETPTETVSGQSFTITATVRSNATTPISGIVLLAAYPQGYSLASSSPTSIGTNFLVGTLNPGESQTVTLTGTLSGQDNDQRVFSFTVGTARGPNDPSLAVSYMTQTANVTITAPFLATAILVNNSSEDNPVVAPATQVVVTVNWTNTLAVPVDNADIEVAVTGGGVDYGSIQTQDGFYRSSDQTVLFNTDTNPGLSALAPGASGSGTFTFTSSGGRSGLVNLAVSIAGQREGQSGVPEQVSASATKTIKVASAVALTTAALHAAGPFPNSGPIPPVPNQQTSYTIVWSVRNSGNELANATLRATLPSYVSFPGMVSPADGSITYDDVNHTVTWNIGDMAGGASAQASFQVILTPSTSQENTSPSLISPSQFSGFDRYAQVNITSQGPSASTQTTGDPGYVSANGVVQ